MKRIRKIKASELLTLSKDARKKVLGKKTVGDLAEDAYQNDWELEINFKKMRESKER